MKIAQGLAPPRFEATHMLCRFLTRSIIASLFVVALTTLGCGQASPSGPSVIPTAFSLRSIAPAAGAPEGRTVVTLFGSGFQSGARVTFDGAAASATVNSSTIIVATTPAHAAGAVDVVVMNPDGQTGRLIGAYTYAAAPTLPAPAVMAISPNIGSTGGGTPFAITGSGFRGTGYQSGVTVTLGDAIIIPLYANTTTIWAETPAHVAGRVDVVVTNSDGQTATLAEGYVFAPAQSFDFNGSWLGGHDEPPIRFTIQNDTLTSVGCGTSPNVTFSPPLPVSNGEFSFSTEDGVSVSGRIVSPGVARGRINMAPCTAIDWYAERQ